VVKERKTQAIDLEIYIINSALPAFSWVRS